MKEEAAVLETDGRASRQQGSSARRPLRGTTPDDEKSCLLSSSLLFCRAANNKYCWRLLPTNTVCVVVAAAAVSSSLLVGGIAACGGWAAARRCRRSLLNVQQVVRERRPCSGGAGGTIHALPCALPTACCAGRPCLQGRTGCLQRWACVATSRCALLDKGDSQKTEVSPSPFPRARRRGEPSRALSATTPPRRHSPHPRPRPAARERRGAVFTSGVQAGAPPRMHGVGWRAEQDERVAAFGRAQGQGRPSDPRTLLGVAAVPSPRSGVACGVRCGVPPGVRSGVPLGVDPYDARSARSSSPCAESTVERGALNPCKTRMIRQAPSLAWGRSSGSGAASAAHRLRSLGGQVLARGVAERRPRPGRQPSGPGRAGDALRDGAGHAQRAPSGHPHQPARGGPRIIGDCAGEGGGAAQSAYGNSGCTARIGAPSSVSERLPGLLPQLVRELVCRAAAMRRARCESHTASQGRF